MVNLSSFKYQMNKNQLYIICLRSNLVCFIGHVKKTHLVLFFENFVFYQDAASNNQPGITYSSLKSQISKHEGLLENLTISIDRWLVPPKPKRIIQAVNDAFQVTLYVDGNSKLG